MAQGQRLHNIRHRLIETFPDTGINEDNPASHNVNTATQPPVPLSSSSSSSNSSISLTAVGGLIIAGLLAVLILSLWYITWKTLRYYRLRTLRHDIMLMGVAHLSASRGPDVNSEENQPWYEDETATFERLQRRYETIEHWTITKRAREHTTCCNAVQVQRRSSDSSGCVTTSGMVPQCIPSTLSDEVVNNPPSDFDSDVADVESGHECPICMSKFEVGDILSWSSNPKCIHVYHHECIKEWLLRHKECCLCKQIYVPIDAKSKQSQHLNKSGTLPDFINELSQQFRTSVATSYYCIEHGLVRIPELFYCTESELEQLEHLVIDSTIAPADLTSFRGNYHEYENPDHPAMESSPMEAEYSDMVDVVVAESDSVISTNDDPVVEPMEPNETSLQMETNQASRSDPSIDEIDINIVATARSYCPA